MVDSSCFLVSAKPSFYPVFGRFWTQIGPKFGVEVPAYVCRANGAAFREVMSSRAPRTGGFLLVPNGCVAVALWPTTAGGKDSSGQMSVA